MYILYNKCQHTQTLSVTFITILEPITLKLIEHYDLTITYHSTDYIAGIGLGFLYFTAV